MSNITPLARRIAALVLGTLAMATAHADATQFPVPTQSVLSRAEVQAEARRALLAGELRRDEATQRVTAPKASLTTRSDVRAEASRARMQPSRAERRTASLDHVGGM